MSHNCHFIELNVFDPSDPAAAFNFEFNLAFSCDGCGKAAEGVMFGRQLCRECIADRIERGI
jgi:hypothetical protein